MEIVLTRPGVVHELDDDGVALGDPIGPIARTRCGFMGVLKFEPYRHVIMSSINGALRFRLSRMGSIVEPGDKPWRAVHQRAVERTTCRNCLRWKTENRVERSES